MSQPNEVSFNWITFKRFITAYTEAVKDEKTVFKFDGKDYYAPYAKYLIEYLTDQFDQAI